VTASVVTAGIVVLDRTWEIAEHPVRPIKVAAEAYRESGGGMAAAAAVSVASLGGRAVYWGRVGDDEAGDWLLRELGRRDVDIAGVRRIVGAQTPSSGVLIDRRGERMLAVFRGRGLDPDPEFLPLPCLDDAGAVMVDMRWVEGALAVLDAARARGRPRVLDADHGMQDALVRLLPLADHIVFSALGLAEFAATSDPAAGLRAVSERVSGVVGVTLGEEGSLWRLGGREFRVPGLNVAVCDTNGAGDVFHGAYALGLAEGMGVAEAARFANAAAALKCARGNGWSGMPDRATVLDMLR
jgi:sulfofructose kinase